MYSYDSEDEETTLQSPENYIKWLFYVHILNFFGTCASEILSRWGRLADEKMRTLEDDGLNA